MRTFRLLLTISSMTAIAVGGLVACGDDDTNGTTPPAADSGTTSSSSSSSSSSSGNSGDGGAIDSGAPKAVAVAKNVYLGETATLDGTASTGAGLTYAWTITAPGGSAITTASLQNANTSKATFVPDKLGAYSATLTVTSGGTTTTATATVNAVDAPVFFFSATDDAGNGNAGASFRVANANGAGDLGTAVACFEADGGTAADHFTQLTEIASGNYADWWEAPAGQPSRGVLVYETNADGGSSTTMMAVTSDGTCATPPRVLDGLGVSPADIPLGIVIPSDHSAYDLPKLSPNGERVAYMRFLDNKTQIATIGFDGSSPHNHIAPRGADDAGAPDLDAGRWEGNAEGPRPVWINDTTIAWLQIVNTSSWQIVTATDQDNATPQVYMRCDGEPPVQFDILPSGEVLMGLNAHFDAGTTIDSVDLVASAADPATKKCSASPRNLTKLVAYTASTSGIDQFTLSRDKSKIAVAIDQQDDAGVAQRGIYVLPADGSSAPKLIGLRPNLTVGGPPSVAPRWIAGDTAITWVTATTFLDAGDAAAVTSTDVIAVAPQEGTGGGHIVASSTDPTAKTALFGVGSVSCSFGAGVGSGISGFGFLGLLGLGVTRRRRNKK